MKKILNYIRWRFIEKRPTRIEDVWYNYLAHVEEQKGGIAIFDKEREYIDAEKGKVVDYVFKDGDRATYKITKVKWAYQSDYLYNTDRIRVDLRLCPGIPNSY